jgi:hypothetical protein
MQHARRTWPVLTLCAGLSCRPSETDIPVRHLPGSRRDQVSAADPSLGAPKALSHPQDTPPDLSRAAADASAAAGESYPQHSSMQGPRGLYPAPPQGYSHPVAPPASAAYPSYPNPYGSHTPADAQAAEQAAAFMAAAAAANMRSAQGAAAGSYSSQEPMQQQQHHQQQQAQGPPQLGSPGLPEAAPALKTDPVELSLLTKYLQIVRQTQVSWGCAARGLARPSCCFSDSQLAPWLTLHCAARLTSLLIARQGSCALSFLSPGL